MQRFLDAAFELIDEKGTTEFTIQEVIDRSKQSLRGFYQYFDGKDELLLALFEETLREATDDLRRIAETDADPFEQPQGVHHPSPRVVRSVREAAARDRAQPPPDHGFRGPADRRPLDAREGRARADLADDGRRWSRRPRAAGAIDVPDVRRAAALMQQTIMYSWFGNRVVEQSRTRLTAEATWDFCLHGLGVARERSPLGPTAVLLTRTRRAGRADARSRSHRASA